MPTLKFSDMQFASSPRSVAIAPGTTVGKRLTAGKSMVSSRRPPRTTSGPAISRLALCFDKLLKESAVSAIGNEEGAIYCEVASSGETIGFYFDGFTMHTTAISSINSNRASALVPLLLHAVTKNEAAFLETQQSVEDLVQAYEVGAGTVEVAKLAYACDCFYYDTKDHIPAEINLVAFDTNIRLQVEQALRASHLRPIKKAGLEPHLNLSFNHIEYTPTAATASKTTPKAIVNEFYDRCKTGEFDVGFEWSSEQQKRIRPLSFLDRFVPNNAHKMITMLADHDLSQVIDRVALGKSGADAIQDNYLNVILVGKPGTGKTTTAEALSATLGLPIYTVSLSKGTEEDEMQGKTKIVEGKFEFKETPFLEAYENGGIIVLEEFNLADPGMMQGAIGQAIEYPFVLLKDGYKEITRHPMCVFISTMNTATQGAREPNEALTSRSPVTIVMEDPNDDEFVEILVNKGYERKECSRVFSAYKEIMRYLRDEAGSEELLMCITLRHCLGALKLLNAGFEFKDAIKSSMIGSIAIKDLALANDVYTNVICVKRF